MISNQLYKLPDSLKALPNFSDFLDACIWQFSLPHMAWMQNNKCVHHLCLSLPLAWSLPCKQASPIRFSVVALFLGIQGWSRSQCFLSSFFCRFTIPSSNLRYFSMLVPHFIYICPFLLMVSFSAH